MSYAFRNTFRQDIDTFIEDRGYPRAVRRGDADFGAVEQHFASMIAVGQTALHGEGEGIWEVVDGCPMLEDARARKLEALRGAWLEAEKKAVVETAGGWLADADERANRDLEGLVTAMEATGTGTVQFCGADNVLREVTLEQVKAIRLQVIAHAKSLYAHKWEKRAAIESAQTFEALDAVQISFEGV